MIHKHIIVKSGPHVLRKMTKTQVIKEIRDAGSWHGFLCGNRVNPAYIAEGWHLGMRADVTSETALRTLCDTFETGLKNDAAELEDYPHFYQIVTINWKTKKVKAKRFE